MSSKKQKPVRWLCAAREDVEEIIEHVAQDSSRAAEQLAEAILAKVEQLKDFPYLGGVSPYSRRVRHLIHGNYVIYYTVHRHEVVVRAVVHGARLFRSAWFRRGE